MRCTGKLYHTTYSWCSAGRRLTVRVSQRFGRLIARGSLRTERQLGDSLVDFYFLRGTRPLRWMDSISAYAPRTMNALERLEHQDLDLDNLLKALPACRRCRANRRRCDPHLPSCRNCFKARVECIYYDHVLGEELPRRYVQICQRSGRIREHLADWVSAMSPIWQHGSSNSGSRTLRLLGVLQSK